ncbi:hypothetical protein [Blastopirellula marina]|uniref:Host attachment protein n=1 Tax=Blastopirellula marina DSM 3645 TaxID=314230 RepID=A3ZX48_9BACT|nr:hypothetical protein [Blastopirellula marina]EAQ78925.1 hypothetical protein DSM3645_27633 [Blastopirellula marina DSM 3645]
MATKAGVWIDHQNAIIVSITAAGEEITRLTAGDQEAFPPSIESREQHRYTPHDFVAEDKLERKQANEEKKMYVAVMAALQGAESILILGPGEAKGAFQKYLAGQHELCLEITVSPADKMTDPQLIAKVREHFGVAKSRSFHRGAQK